MANQRAGEREGEGEEGREGENIYALLDGW